MWQEIYRIPGLDLPIFGYGLMLVIGFLTAAQLARLLANRFGLNGEHFINAALIALVLGIVGARLSHILENLDQFTRADRSPWQNLLEMINLRSGGLTFYGGFLLAFPSLVGYALWMKIPLRLGMDIAAPCLMIGLGFGRIGCFLNGCCHGADCDAPSAWTVQFPYYSNAYIDHHREGKLHPPAGLLHDGRLRTPSEVQGDPDLQRLASAERSRPVHPAQLYSAFNAFLIAGITFAYLTVPHALGRGFALMMMLKGVTRFLLEMIRTEPAVLGPMSLSMVISIGVVALGIALWVLFGRLASTSEPSPLPRSPSPAPV